MDTLNLSILSEERRNILPSFISWKDEFYLAGGTADFNFFSCHLFDTEVMMKRLSTLFGEKSFTITQIEKNTLSIILHTKIKISFMTYEYELINPLIKTEYMNIASVPDIACMKLSAIMQRSALKDYVDLYEIMKIYSLEKLLSFAKKKYPTIDSTVVLKSLSYLDDIVDEPLIYQGGYSKPQLNAFKLFFQTEVKRYMSTIIL
jgi:predicted nucleotidyltransferase component of viral defense system